jgi:hypothetical protein
MAVAEAKTAVLGNFCPTRSPTRPLVNNRKWARPADSMGFQVGRSFGRGLDIFKVCMYVQYIQYIHTYPYQVVFESPGRPTAEQLTSSPYEQHTVTHFKIRRRKKVEINLDGIPVAICCRGHESNWDGPKVG